MADTVTVRLDSESFRILKELARQTPGSKSDIIRQALRTQWEAETGASGLSAWEGYKTLNISPGRPHHDRARHASELIKEKLSAKHRNGAL